MLKRTLLAASAAAVMAVPAFAKDTVVFWQFSTRDAYINAWEAAIADFESQNPDIDVVMEIVPWSEQQQRLISALTTGGLPDVSMLGNNVVAQFQAIGALAPLTTYFEAHGAEHGYDVAGDIWPGDRGYYELAGEWWASALAVETRSLYYRKDLMEAAGLDPENPPATWTELVEAAKAITEATDAFGWAAPMSIDYLTLQNFMSVYLSHGARLLGDDGQCGLDSAEFRQALTLYTDAFKAGVTHPDAATMPGNEFRRGFLDGNYAMIVDQPGIYADLQNEGAEFADMVGVATVPAGPEGTFGFLGGWPLVLWDASENKDAAAAWILHATRPEGALKELSINSGMIPGSRSLAQGEPWDAAPFDVFVSQLEDAYPYQHPDEAIAQMGQLEVDTIQKAIQAVALGEATVDEATVRLCRDINEVLAR